MSTQPEPTKLSEEDNARIRRLHDEIAGRYAEIGLIIGRAIGRDDLSSIALAPGGHCSVTYKIRKGETTARGRDDSYVCIEVDGGAWEDPPGWCRSGGCY